MSLTPFYRLSDSADQAPVVEWSALIFAVVVSTAFVISSVWHRCSFRPVAVVAFEVPAFDQSDSDSFESIAIVAWVFAFSGYSTIYRIPMTA